MMSDKNDTNGFASLNLKKIFGLIPESLYETISKLNLFNNGWDSWLATAIIEKLKRDNYYDVQKCVNISTASLIETVKRLNKENKQIEEVWLFVPKTPNPNFEETITTAYPLSGSGDDKHDNDRN